MIFDFFNPEDFSSFDPRMFQKLPSIPNHMLSSIVITIKGGPTLTLSDINFMEANNEIVKFMVDTPPIPKQEAIQDRIDTLSKIPTILEQNVNTRRRIKSRNKTRDDS